MATIAPTQFYRDLDLQLLKADEQGYIKSYIIIPPAVYGVATGPLVARGIQKQQTGLLPRLLNASLARGQGGMVGEGKNVWQNVDLQELSDLYIILYNAIMVDNEKIGHGHAGFYFAENGAHEMSEVSTIIARVLFEHGKGYSPNPSSFTENEMEKYLAWVGPLIGSNAKCVANRARALGWKPTKSTSALLETVREVATSYVSGQIAQ